MNVIQSLYLVLLIALFPGIAKSEDKPAKEGVLSDQEWTELAATKEAATLRLDVVDQTRGQPYNGFFISDDGLALIQLFALSQKAKPTVVTANGTRLKLGTILKLFPSHGLALIKFKHRPKSYLEIADKEPAIGESIALVPTDFSERDVIKVGIPPVVGPIMAKRSSLNRDFGYRFIKTLSLGSRLTTEQEPHVASGVIAVNRSGALVAVFHSQSGLGTYPLLKLTPVAALADVVSKIDRKGKGLPFPLPKTDVIFDPLYSDHVYNRIAAPGPAGREPEERHRVLKDLLARFPKNHSLKDVALQSYDPENPLVDLEDFPEPDPTDPVAYRVSVLSCRVFFLIKKEPVDLAVKTRKAAIALSPKDYPIDRYMLARQYMNLGRFDDAEEMMREIYPFLSDDIEVVDLYRTLLVRARKWEELREVEKRIRELDKTYAYRH